MRIEVYLKHIFQEYPVTESLAISARPGVQTWDLKYERNCGCRGNVAMVPLDVERVYIRRVFLRQESFGGLLYDPTSAVIYRLDHEAYQLVQRLQTDEDVDTMRGDERAIAAFAKRHGLEERGVGEFIAQLEEFNLW